jgi:enoyl-CoA hydratase/carnithine racemase
MTSVRASWEDTRYDTLLVSERNDAIWVVLNRPEALNATTATMLHELGEVISRAHHDEDVRALVLTGAGRAFCIGSDLAFLSDALKPGNLDQFRDYLIRINSVFLALEALPIPTIAMVNGKARAGGFEMLLACDLVILADDARVGDVHTPFGHMPGAGATQRLPRKIGYQLAFEIICSGRWLTADEAVSCGLAFRAVPRDQLRLATEEVVSSLVDKTRPSLGYIKRAMQRGMGLPLEDGIALESHCYLEYLATCAAPLEAFRVNQERRRNGLQPIAQPKRKFIRG